MAFYRRSFSDTSGGKKQRKRSRTNSIFERTISLFVGASDSEDSSDETPDSRQDQKEFRLSRDDAWMQASFTTAGLVFVFIMGCILLAVYYILEPFLHPLLWAVLVGMVLHPFKHASTSEIHDWLAYLDNSGIPLSLGTVLSPYFLFNWLSQCFENIFFSNWKTIIGLVIGMVAMVIGYVFSLPLYTLRLVQVSSGIMDSINSFMTHTGWIQVCSLVLGFSLLLVMSNRYSSHSSALQAFSICLWFFAMLNIGTYLLGSLTVPVVCSLFLSAIAVSTTKNVIGTFNKSKSHDDNNEGLLEKGLTTQTLQKMISQDSDVLEVDIQGTETPLDIEEKTESTSGFSDNESDQRDTQTEEKVFSQKQVSFNPAVGMAPSVDRSNSPSPLNTPDSNPQLFHSSKPRLPAHLKPKKSGKIKLYRGAEEVDGGRFKRFRPPRQSVFKTSNQVFLVLFIACLLVTLWKHPILLLVPIPLTLWCIIKYVVTLAVVQNSVLSHVSNSSQTAQNWLVSQKQILCPWPLPTMYAMYLFIDKKVLEGVKKSMGSLVSALIIVLLLVVVVAVAVLVLFQIQVEVMHYAGAAVSVWNTTIASNPQIKEWIGVSEENETLQDSLENFASQNYAYAREKLGDWLHTLVSDSPTNTTMMEQRVLELFDTLYSVYVVQNTTVVTPSVHPTEGVTVADQLAGDDEGLLWTFTKLLPLVNVDTAVTVLKSVWAFLFDNLAVALSFLYTFIQLLLSGGTVLINSIVFLTALFYLLSYSEQNYLPVKWVMDFLPHLTPSPQSDAGDRGGAGGSETSEDYGKVFSRAIRSVFLATLRRAFFYGLYNWLTHTLFGLPVSILPAVLAGLAGAIPFVGAYWVAMPAVLELWLLQGSLLSALTLFALSVLPVFFVDTLINREIEGGHPYLTGLAIAGGIYFAGLEGALFGPILLSCLLFVVDFYDASFV